MPPGTYLNSTLLSGFEFKQFEVAFSESVVFAFNVSVAKPRIELHNFCKYTHFHLLRKRMQR